MQTMREIQMSVLSPSVSTNPSQLNKGSDLGWRVDESSFIYVICDIDYPSVSGQAEIKLTDFEAKEDHYII